MRTEKHFNVDYYGRQLTFKEQLANWLVVLDHDLSDFCLNEELHATLEVRRDRIVTLLSVVDPGVVVSTSELNRLYNALVNADSEVEVINMFTSLETEALEKKRIWTHFYHWQQALLKKHRDKTATQADPMFRLIDHLSVVLRYIQNANLKTASVTSDQLQVLRRLVIQGVNPDIILDLIETIVE